MADFLEQRVLDNQVLAKIQEAAIQAYPNEACGVITTVGKRGTVIPCTNISSEPTKFFVIDPRDYARAAKQGDIVAIWHSHPEGSSQASGFDISGVEATALNWMIIGIKKQDDGFVFEEMKVYSPVGTKTPYTERPYVVGIYDCYTLLRDYYAREFNVELAVYMHSESWWTEGKNLLVDNFEAEGFVKLVNQSPELGDCFLLQAGSDTPNHVMIYVGDDKILHHCYGRLSRYDVYGGGYWQKHTSHHLRHKSRIKNAD